MEAGFPWPSLGKLRIEMRSFAAPLRCFTVYCVDIDPHEPCMYEWSSKPLGRTVSVRIMRCGSTTPTSAVGDHHLAAPRSGLWAQEHAPPSANGSWVGSLSCGEPVV